MIITIILLQVLLSSRGLDHLAQSVRAGSRSNALINRMLESNEGVVKWLLDSNFFGNFHPYTEGNFQFKGAYLFELGGSTIKFEMQERNMVALGFLKSLVLQGFTPNVVPASAMACLHFKRLRLKGRHHTWRQFCGAEQVKVQDLGTKATSEKITVDELAKTLVGETDVLSTILQTFKREKVSDFTRRDLNQAVSACAKRSFWQEACLLLASVPRNRTDVISFNATISACEKGMQWQFCLYFLNEMTRFKRKIIPDTITFNTIIHSCEKSREWQRALHLLEEMLFMRVSPDVITFSTLMGGCDTLGQWQATLLLLQRMFEEDLQPNSICFASAINSGEKSSCWQDALSLLMTRSANLRLNGLTFTAGIRAAKRGKQWQSALELLQMMPSSKIKPTQLSFCA